MFLSHFLVNIRSTTTDKVVEMLFSQCRATLMNICWLKFHFQLTINVETTLSHRRWIDIIRSMLFQRFVNVETTSINIGRLNFHFQPNYNVETMLMKVGDQRCFNVDSTLMCLLEYYSQKNTKNTCTCTYVN